MTRRVRRLKSAFLFAGSLFQRLALLALDEPHVTISCMNAKLIKSNSKFRMVIAQL